MRPGGTIYPRRFLPVALLLAAILPFPISTEAARNRPVRQAQPAPTDWLRTHAWPLHGVDPDLGLADLRALTPSLENAGIIGLGDASHGTREFYLVKHRLIEFLVREQGFTVIALEAPWPRLNRIDDWVQGGEGDPAELLDDQDYWFWNTEEILDFLWWVRNYNMSRADRPAVTIAGTDAVMADDLIDDVISYLRQVDPEAVAAAKQTYSCIPSNNWGRREAAGVIPSATSPCLDAADLMTQFLTERRDVYVQRSSERRFNQVLQSSRMIRQSGEIAFDSRSRRQETRDQKMGENVAWLREHAFGAQRKVVFWGHNFHVQRVPYSLFPGGPPNRSAGTVLAERYSDYYVIGTATLRGRWIGITSQINQTYETREVPALPADSYEHLFAAAGHAVAFVPLRESNIPAEVLQPRPLLVMFASPYFQIFRVPIAELFDAVIFVEETSETTLRQ